MCTIGNYDYGFYYRLMQVCFSRWWLLCGDTQPHNHTEIDHSPPLLTPTPTTPLSHQDQPLPPSSTPHTPTPANTTSPRPITPPSSTPHTPTPKHPGRDRGDGGEADRHPQRGELGAGGHGPRAGRAPPLRHHAPRRPGQGMVGWLVALHWMLGRFAWSVCLVAVDWIKLVWSGVGRKEREGSVVSSMKKPARLSTGTLALRVWDLTSILPTPPQSQRLTPHPPPPKKHTHTGHGPLRPPPPAHLLRALRHGGGRRGEPRQGGRFAPLPEGCVRSSPFFFLLVCGREYGHKNTPTPTIPPSPPLPPFLKTKTHQHPHTNHFLPPLVPPPKQTPRHQAPTTRTTAPGRCTRRCCGRRRRRGGTRTCTGSASG